MEKELLFLELKTKKTFTIPSWEFVSSNGGLKKIISSMGFDYDDCYQRDAIMELSWVPTDTKQLPDRKCMEALDWFNINT